MTISKGSKLPAAPDSLWESAPNSSVTFPSTGKIIILGVPGAFTPPCSSQVPGYISNYSKFTAKGVSDIYVVAINDIFVVEAWKKSLPGGDGSSVHFVADSTGDFIKSLGLDFDAKGLLGNARSKRFAAVVVDGVVNSIVVEDEAPNVIDTAADEVLKTL